MRKYYKHPVEFIINIKKIVTIEYMELSKDFFLSIENHNFYEFVYVDRGTAIYDVDGQKFTLKTQEILLVEPKKNHTICGDNKNATNLFILCFECSSPYIFEINQFSVKLNSSEKQIVNNILHEANGTYILPLYDQKKYTDSPLIGGEQSISLYLELLLITLIRNKHGNKKNIHLLPLNHPINNLYLLIIDYLSKSVYCKININNLCENFHYSKTYLSSFFKKMSGESIIEYFNNLKIKEAKKMLLETNYTSAQISDSLSFSDPRYFTYLFKKTTGVTPSQFRKSINPTL